MERCVQRGLGLAAGMVGGLMLLGLAHAWLVLPCDDPRLTRRQEVLARTVPPYAAWLLLESAYAVATIPAQTRALQWRCYTTLAAQGYREWARVRVCDCHVLEGESLAACFARH